MPETAEQAAVRRASNLARCPAPLGSLIGRNLLIYQDDYDEKHGNLYLTYENIKAQAHKPGRGTVVQVGDGYDPNEIHVVDPDAFRANCPFKAGDRVFWSIYDDYIVSLRVDSSWFSAEKIAEMRNLRREFEESFIIIRIDQAKLSMEAPEKEIWEREVWDVDD